MNLKNKNIAEGMRVTNGKDKLRVVSWDKSYSDCLLNYLDSKGNRYVVAQDYELSGTEKDPQIFWMNGRYFTANSDDEAFETYLDYLGGVHEYDISESLKKKSLKEMIDRNTWKNWKIEYVHHIEYFFNGRIVDAKTLQSLFNSEGFDTDVETVEKEIEKDVRSYKLGNLDGTAIHIAHNNVGTRIDLVFNIGGLIGEVESLSKGNDTCVVVFNGDIYEADEMWNFGYKIYVTCSYVTPMDFALNESKKKSLKESEDYNSDISLYDNLYYQNPNKVPSLNSDMRYELINYAEENGVSYNKCKNWTYREWMNFVIKTEKKSIKESAKPINEKNVAKFVDELNKWCDDNVHYKDVDSAKFTKQYGKLYDFGYNWDYSYGDKGDLLVFDKEETLDWYDDEVVVPFIKELAKKYGWYCEPAHSYADFMFAEL